MKRVFLTLFLLGIAVLAAGLWITRPRSVPPERFAGLAGDAARGEEVFFAAGCASCHKAKDSADPTRLPGGQRFVTAFGTFVAPNISPDPVHGIGGWSLVEFASALRNGTSPGGEHLYPALPYASYARMRDGDLADLWTYLGTLPAEPRANQPHELKFPFNIRLLLGGWKLLYLDRDWVAQAPTPELERGRYLVEALGHCAECHTPRDLLGGPDLDAWMAGAANPSGKGRIPGLTPDKLDWPASDIAYYLQSGFTPDFDSAGGEMVDVIDNISRLGDEDRAAIAAYLKALPGG